MRTLSAVLVPWIVWGFLDNGIYAGLVAAMPDAFNDKAVPDGAAMLLALLVLRAGYSVIAGALSAKISGPDGERSDFWAALLLLGTGGVVQGATWELYPIWYSAGFLLPIVPAAMGGARLVRGRATPGTAAGSPPGGPS